MPHCQVMPRTSNG